jgi:alpha-mannosidase
LVYRDLHYLEDQADGGDGYDFYAIPGDKPITTLQGSAKIAGEKTPFGAVFKIQYVIALPASLSEDRLKRSVSTIPQIVRSKIRIMDHTPTIEISTKLENQIKDHRLRAVFPTPLKTDKVAAGSIFDVVERGIGIEGQEPFDRWVQQAEPTSHTSNFIDLYQPTVGSMAVFNKGMPEYEARRYEGGLELIQTLFRSVAFEGGNLPTRGGAGSPIPTPEAQLLRSLSFDYAVHFHANDWKADHIPNKANEYLLPIARAGGKIYVPGRRAEQFDIFDRYPRNLSSRQILLQASNPSVVLTSFKLAEESQHENEIVIRLYNPFSEPANVDLTFGFAISNVQIVNLLEEQIRDSPCKITASTKEKLSVLLSKKAILTLKLTL